MELNVPLVSIIVPTRNSAATLQDCLQSLKNQSYPHIEIIVVDNFSTDSTTEICATMNVTFLQRGPERSTQRNVGVAHASGNYVMIIDADMTTSPTTVEECVMLCQRGQHGGIVIPLEELAPGFWGRCRWLERRCYDGTPLVEASRFFSIEAYRAVGGFDERLYAFEDWDLHHRVVAAGFSSLKASRRWALLYHNEGRISLRSLTRKRAYYGEQLALYTSKHPALAHRQFSLRHRANIFLKHWPLMTRHPILAAGLFVMKGIEAAAAHSLPWQDVQ